MSNETYINTGTSFQQPFNDRRPVQQSYQYNNQENKQRPVQQSYQYNNVENRQRPARQSYQYNNVENRQRPARQSYQYNNVETRQRPARQSYQYHNRVQQNTQQPYTYHNRVQQNTQQDYTYHNRVDRQRPVQQDYTYHNRVQQNTQQPYQYHNRIQTTTQQTYTYHNRVQQNTQQVYTYHNRVQENTQQNYQFNQPTPRRRPARTQAHTNFIHYMRVYGGGGDSAAVRMDTPYGQVSNTIPSFEFSGFPMQQQINGIFSSYPFPYQQGGTNIQRSGNFHEGDSFRGAMFFRGPTLNFMGQQGPQAAGTGSPYYEGGSTAQSPVAFTLANSYNYNGPQIAPFGQVQRQWNGRLRYVGENTIFAANMTAHNAPTNQSVPNPQRQGHPSGQGNQGVEFLTQYPASSQYAIKLNSGQQIKMGWEHYGSFTEQFQSSPNFPAGREPLFVRGDGVFSRVRPRTHARQEQFTAGVMLSGSNQPTPTSPNGTLNDKQLNFQQTYIYHNRVTRQRPVRTQRNEDVDRRRPVRVQVNSEETRRRPTRVQQLQRVSRRRPVRVQVNSNETRRRPTRVQVNSVDTKQRPVQQTYQYNNVVQRQRPVRVQTNAEETRRRPARVQVLQRVSKQRSVQQAYSYHNQVPRRKSIQQTYSYHNRVTRQKNLQQTYSYHNQVPRRRPVQQTYNYHNQIPRRRPVRQPFPSTRTIGPLAKVKQIWINDGGVLRKMDEVYVNNSGTLKKTHQSVPTSQLTDPNT